MAWYADLLGHVRDRDVLSRRLTELIADLPVDQVRGPVEGEITKTLATERDEAIQRLNKAMRTSRYRHLMQLLRSWKTAPPLTDAAAEKDTAAKYVENAQRKAANGSGRPAMTSNSCTGPARRSSGRGTPLKSSSRPTAI